MGRRYERNGRSSDREADGAAACDASSLARPSALRSVGHTPQHLVLTRDWPVSANPHLSTGHAAMCVAGHQRAASLPAGRQEGLQRGWESGLPSRIPQTDFLRTPACQPAVPRPLTDCLESVLSLQFHAGGKTYRVLLSAAGDGSVHVSKKLLVWGGQPRALEGAQLAHQGWAHGENRGRAAGPPRFHLLVKGNSATRRSARGLSSLSCMKDGVLRRQRHCGQMSFRSCNFGDSGYSSSLAEVHLSLSVCLSPALSLCRCLSPSVCLSCSDSLSLSLSPSV